MRALLEKLVADKSSGTDQSMPELNLTQNHSDSETTQPLCRSSDNYQEGDHDPQEDVSDE